MFVVGHYIARLMTRLMTTFARKLAYQPNVHVVEDLVCHDYLKEETI